MSTLRHAVARQSLLCELLTKSLYRIEAPYGHPGMPYGQTPIQAAFRLFEALDAAEDAAEDAASSRRRGWQCDGRLASSAKHLALGVLARAPDPTIDAREHYSAPLPPMRSLLHALDEAGESALLLSFLHMQMGTAQYVYSPSRPSARKSPSSKMTAAVCAILWRRPAVDSPSAWSDTLRYASHALRLLMARGAARDALTLAALTDLRDAYLRFQPHREAWPVAAQLLFAAAL